MSENNSLTEEEKKQLDEIAKRVGADNWSLICFTQVDNEFNAYSQLINEESLYKLIMIMRELFLRVINEAKINFATNKEGNC